MPGLILQHEADDRPGLLGEWLGENSIDYDLVDVLADGVPEDPAPYGFVVSLGSTCSVNDASLPWVGEEAELLRRCATDSEETPVFGICFGGQLLARSLGAEVWPTGRLEIGWLTLDSVDPGLLPEGPWPFWHEDAFGLPAGAAALSMRGEECQAFLYGRSIGVQFHPEATPEIFASWAKSISPAELQTLGTPGELLREEAQDSGPAGRIASHRLFESFFRMVAEGEATTTDVGRTEHESRPGAVAPEENPNKNQADSLAGTKPQGSSARSSRRQM